MFPVWTAVKVKTEGHEREGQAGVVHETNQFDHPDSVVVKFDKDQSLVDVATADLVAL